MQLINFTTLSNVKFFFHSSKYSGAICMTSVVICGGFMICLGNSACEMEHWV